MKKRAVHWFTIVLTVCCLSCEKDIAEPPVTNQKGSRITPTLPGGDNTGQLAVYAASNNGCAGGSESIKVYIDGDQVGELKLFFPTSSPLCGEAGTITQILTPGVYSVYAECSSSFWPKKNITVQKGLCTTYRLY